MSIWHAQMKPSIVPLMDGGKCEYKVKDEEFGTQTQTCPPGTVPIRRSSKKDLITAQILKKTLSQRTSINKLNGYHV